MLRRICGAKRDEVTGKWRRIHNEELYAPYAPNIKLVIKSRIGWMCNVAHMGFRGKTQWKTSAQMGV
jgi:hypothetical protein